MVIFVGEGFVVIVEKRGDEAPFEVAGIGNLLAASVAASL